VDTPQRWREYQCDEYFRDGWAERGLFELSTQCWVIVPASEAYEETEFEFFAIGRSGMNADFGYRKGHGGLWAFHPIDCRFKFMADTVADLAAGWSTGKLRI
jgi:hypothetical protein